MLAIQNKVCATIGIGLKSPSTGNANYAKIGGYNSSDVTADPPTLTITYSIGTPQKPSTDFYASKTKFRIGDSIQFFDNSGFSPSSWLWEFGDGSTSTLKNPWKLYDSIGSYSVKLTATNAAGSKDTTFNNYITVRPLNVAPLAVNDTVYTDVNAEVEIYFAENDVENDGDLDYFSLKMDSAMMPQNGTVTYDTTGQFFLYAPNLDFNGLDSFKYIISDNDSAYSNVGVVYITVGDDSTGLSVFNERILSGLSVYPNPAQEYVFLKSSQGSIQSIELRDIAGKLVYASSIKAKETKVNVSMLNSGLYFMNCRIEGQNYSLKLIKK